MHRLILAILFASTALSQDLTRTFQLRNTPPIGLQEIATTLRTVFDVKQLSVDPSLSTLTLTGSSGQIALAEWLLPKLDTATGSSQKYFYGGDTSDVVDLIQLKNAAQSTNLQEMLTTLRTVADIQRIYQSTLPRILIMRSDPGHIAMADFLVTQLDLPASPRTSPTVQTFQPVLPGNFRDKNDGVLVYGLANTPNNQELQVIITTMRTVLSIQKIYQYTSPKMLAIRADADRLRMAEWLIPKLDTAEPVAGDIQMQYPGGKDDVVKVFYVPEGSNLGDMMTSVRTVARIPIVYQNFVPPAIVVRSTADQVAVAGKLLAAN